MPTRIISNIIAGRPLVAGTSEMTVRAACCLMAEHKIGALLIVDNKRIAGIFTDGDLRRAVEKVADLKSARIADLMSSGPRLIGPAALAVEAVQLMETHKINQLLVAGDDGVLVGALDMHDLFRAKVV